MKSAEACLRSALRAEHCELAGAAVSLLVIVY